MSGLYDRFYSWIERVPGGKVATYGQIARLAGLPRHSRHVGYALAGLAEDSKLPWHRIVNVSGEISKRDPLDQQEQRRRLEAEGIQFQGERLSLKLYRWVPE